MKQIEEFPDYFIDENGDVWSKSYHPIQNKNCELRKLKPQFNSYGYLHVVLCKDGKKYTKTIHRLVAITFIQNPQNLDDVNHLSGIKTDNRIENLEWCTPSQNTQHSYDNGLQKAIKGEERSDSKLTNEQVIQIREKYRTNQYTQQQLGEEYGVSRRLIGKIVNYKLWKHI